MRVYYLQHADGEDLGNMKGWFEEQGWPINGVRVDRGELLPPLDWFDVLVVLGGPMSVNHTQEHLWLKAEIEFIKAAITEGRTVIGLCLGAQLIARALDTEVTAAQSAEVGWFDITPVGDKAPWLPQGKYLSWHQDSFGLPEGAHCIAKSDHTECQGFVYGERVVALQFHLEATAASPQAFRDAGGSAPDPSATVQDWSDLQGSDAHFSQSQKIMWQLLEHLKPNIQPSAKLSDV